MGDPTQPVTAPRKKTASRRRRWTVRILRGVVLIYLGLVFMFFLLQKKLIFPGAQTQGQRDAILRVGGSQELVKLKTADGEPIVALFGKAEDEQGQPLADADKRPTILYFYGNGSCMAYSTDQFDHFRRLGVNVLLPEFVGYGMSSGKPSEEGCYATADAAYAYLLSRPDIDGKKIVPAGWSLGGAVALDLATRKPVLGLITVSTFTSMNDMGRLVVPWIPTGLILRHHFYNERKIGGITCPIMIVHGTSDTTIPHWMSDRLAAAAKAAVTRYDVTGAEHNDVFDRGGDALYDRIGQFLDGLAEH